MKTKTKLRRYSRIKRKLEPVFAAVDNVVLVVDAKEYSLANKAELVEDFDVAVKAWGEGAEDLLVKNMLAYGQTRRMARDNGFVYMWDMDRRKRETVEFIYLITYTNRTRREWL